MRTLTTETTPDEALGMIVAAAAHIEPSVRRTPCVYSYTFSEVAGCDVYLKLENLQRAGSFKLRGALNKILRLAPGELARGLVAASAGNHAQGVALAAKLVGAQATIVMPQATPLNKVQRTEGYGARVVIEGVNYDAAQRHAAALAHEHGWTLVHAFDDPEIVIGQGTVALELLDEIQDLDAVIVPVGGGGLIAGIALAVKARSPRTRVIGVQAEGSAAMVKSLARGELARVEDPHTIADGIKVGAVSELTFGLARRHVDECVTVSDAQLIDAVVQTLEKSKVVPETAGVAGIAALLAGSISGAKRVCAVVSGGNIDLNLLARIIESGLAHTGRTHALVLRVNDVPGQLAGVLDVLAENECNVLDIEHHRAGWKVPVGKVDIEILLETRKAGAGALVEGELVRRGFELRT